jgi:glycosyltransferase involved in cell wall biosynthesis
MISTHPTSMASPSDPVARVKTAGSTADCPRLAGKRIAMVTFSHYPFDSRPRRAVAALADEGATVDLICLGGENTAKREVLNGVNILRVSINHDRRGKFSYAYRYALFILITTAIFTLRSLSRRYDLVYVHNMPDILVLSSLIPKILGAKVILDLHDPMPELLMSIFNLEKDSMSVRMLRRMEKWSIARTNLVITVNMACKQIFAARSCSPKKILVVMNTPDSKILPFHPAEEFPVTRATDEPFVMMYHGTIVERNGLHLAVEALDLSRAKMPTAELRVYGPRTSFLERVMDMVQKKGMEEIVHYLGVRREEDLVPEIEKCHVGVIPNQRNAFTEINTPTRIFDYLAIGKTAIVPSTAGVKNYFNDESLLFFEAGNVADLAKQMEYAYAHRSKLPEIARKGQQVYLAHTWDQERETLLNGVSELLH